MQNQMIQIIRSNVTVQQVLLKPGQILTFITQMSRMTKDKVMLLILDLYFMFETRSYIKSQLVIVLTRYSTRPTNPFMFLNVKILTETDDTDEDLKASCNLNNTDADPFWSTEGESSSSSEFKKPNFKRFLSQLNKRPYGTTTNPLSVFDNSDSDEHEGDGYVDLEEHEDATVALPASCKYDHGSRKRTKASSFQFTEDVPIDSSESESDDLDDTDLLSVNKRPHRRTQNDKEKVWSGSASRKEKSPSVRKPNMKNTCQIPMDESSDTEVNEKQNTIDELISRYVKGDKAKSVKNGKFKKGGRRDVAACINAILESVINNEEDHITQEDECLPSHFKFDDTEDESSQKSIESNGEELFEEMEFALKCEEVGFYRIPQVENQEEDNYYDDNDLCENGVHGDTYFEEQTGLRCLLCGDVLVESRYVIPKLVSNFKY
ncbi:putative SNF2 domain-containing protein CLSY/DRD1 [Helianthus debilis subsp. tardiflorus]